VWDYGSGAHLLSKAGRGGFPADQTSTDQGAGLSFPDGESELSRRPIADRDLHRPRALSRQADSRRQDRHIPNILATRGSELSRRQGPAQTEGQSPLSQQAEQ
jgi:hypothetical protein